MNLARILVVEDAFDLANVVCRTFTEEGFEAKIAPSGQVAFRLLGQHWDLVVLDLMLPDVTGEEVLRYLSQQPHHPPVLVMTARNALEDKLSLFRLGCDDYLTKPFEIDELIERARAMLRRAPKVPSARVEYEDMALDTGTFRLSVSGGTVVLTPKEAAICEALMREPGRVVSRKELLHTIWGTTFEPQTNFIGVHLLNLRRKLRALGRDEWLNTVRGSGVVLTKPASVQ